MLAGYVPDGWFAPELGDSAEGPAGEADGCDTAGDGDPVGGVGACPLADGPGEGAAQGVTGVDISAMVGVTSGLGVAAPAVAGGPEGAGFPGCDFPGRGGADWHRGLRWGPGTGAERPAAGELAAGEAPGTARGIPGCPPGAPPTVPGTLAGRPPSSMLELACTIASRMGDTPSVTETSARPASTVTGRNRRCPAAARAGLELTAAGPRRRGPGSGPRRKKQEGQAQ